MPYIKTKNKALVKIASGSTEDWSAYYNNTIDILDKPLVQISITAATDIISGDLVIIKSNQKTNKKEAHKLTNKNDITDDDILGVAIENANRDESIMISISGVIELNRFSFDINDKIVYISDDGTITSTPTEMRLGFIISQSGILFDNSIRLNKSIDLSSITPDTILQKINGSKGISVTKNDDIYGIKPVYGVNADTICQGNDPRLHYQNADSGSMDTSFVLGIGANESVELSSAGGSFRSIKFPETNAKLLASEYNLSDLSNVTIARNNLKLSEDDNQTFQNIYIKSLSSKNDDPVTIEGVKIKNKGFQLGKDKEGDLYIRSSSGELAILPIGNNGEILTVTDNNPKWEPAYIHDKPKSIKIENNKTNPDKIIDIYAKEVRVYDTSKKYTYLESLNISLKVDNVSTTPNPLSTAGFKNIWFIIESDHTTTTITDLKTIPSYNKKLLLGILYIDSQQNIVSMVRNRNKTSSSPINIVEKSSTDVATKVELPDSDKISGLHLKWEVSDPNSKFEISYSDTTWRTIATIESDPDRKASGNLYIAINKDKSFYYKRTSGNGSLTISIIGWEE